MKEKTKKTLLSVAKSVGLFLLGIVLKKQKFNKTPQDGKNIDDAIDILKQND